jgi:hypothetical protein
MALRSSLRSCPYANPIIKYNQSSMARNEAGVRPRFVRSRPRSRTGGRSRRIVKILELRR